MTITAWQIAYIDDDRLQYIYEYYSLKKYADDRLAFVSEEFDHNAWMEQIFIREEP